VTALVGVETQEVERKTLAILRIISQSDDPVGARVVSRRLQGHGIGLTERAVRYHLKLMDERGLTHLVGRDGRVITDLGSEELQSALVQDKVGFAISKIEILAFRTDFDPESRTGLIPVNISLFPKEKFPKALTAISAVLKSWLGAANRIAIAREGEMLGEMRIPQGKIGLATVCSVVTNGVLLKSGVPMDSRFGGILQVRDQIPRRFVELIYYDGSSLDPSEVFIRGKMTSVREAAAKGNGKILANFREIPAMCRSLVEETTAMLGEAGLGRPLLIGGISESVCEIPVSLNKIGMILAGGMNPIAAAEEVGFEAENSPMSTVMDYRQMAPIEDI